MCDTWGWKLDEECNCVDKTSYVPECRNEQFTLSGSYCESADGSNYSIKCKPMYTFDETLGTCQIMAEEEVAEMKGARRKGKGRGDKDKEVGEEGERGDKREGKGDREDGEMGEGTRPEGGEKGPSGDRSEGGNADRKRPEGGKQDGKRPEGGKRDGK